KTDARTEIVFISRDERVFDFRNVGERSVAGLHKTVRWTSRRCRRSRSKLIRQEVNEPSARVDRITVKVVAHSKVQRQTRVELPIVLHEAAPIVDPQRAVEHARADDRNTVARQEVVKARKDHLPARERVEVEVDLRATVFTAEPQAMIALDDRERVAVSERVDARRLICKRR